jgi:hypothetical protein
LRSAPYRMLLIIAMVVSWLVQSSKSMPVGSPTGVPDASCSIYVHLILTKFSVTDSMGRSPLPPAVLTD